MAKIEWTTKAVKQLKKVASTMRPVITKAVDALEHYESANNVKRLSNHKYEYRLRVRDYRVMFDIHGDVVEIVLIQEVKKRDESTY